MDLYVYYIYKHTHTHTHTLSTHTHTHTVYTHTHTMSTHTHTHTVYTHTLSLHTHTVRHGLSKTALEDLLDLLRVLGVTESVPVSKYKLLKQVQEDIDDQNVTHFYCGSCSGYVKAIGDTLPCNVCHITVTKTAAFRDGHCFYLHSGR